MLFIIHNKFLLLSADFVLINKSLWPTDVETNPKETNKKIYELIYREFKI